MAIQILLDCKKSDPRAAFEAAHSLHKRIAKDPKIVSVYVIPNTEIPTPRVEVTCTDSLADLTLYLRGGLTKFGRAYLTLHENERSNPETISAVIKNYDAWSVSEVKRLRGIEKAKRSATIYA